MSISVPVALIAPSQNAFSINFRVSSGLRLSVEMISVRSVSSCSDTYWRQSLWMELFALTWLRNCSSSSFLLRSWILASTALRMEVPCPHNFRQDTFPPAWSSSRSCSFWCQSSLLTSAHGICSCIDCNSNPFQRIYAHISAQKAKSSNWYDQIIQGPVLSSSSRSSHRSAPARDTFGPYGPPHRSIRQFPNFSLRERRAAWRSKTQVITSPIFAD